MSVYFVFESTDQRSWKGKESNSMSIQKMFHAYDGINSVSMHFNQYSCQHRTLNLRCIFMLQVYLFHFMHGITVSVCWSLSVAKLWVTYTQHCAWTHPVLTHKPSTSCSCCSANLLIMLHLLWRLRITDSCLIMITASFSKDPGYHSFFNLVPFVRPKM